jgi:hypothetical protein
MNTAIADGFDLGWRLAWVLQAWAEPSLLDGYETERRPFAEHNLTRSAAPDGSRRNVIGELHADLGGRIRHHWLTTDNGQVSTLDLLGPGLTLFTGPDAETWDRAAVTLPTDVPIAVRRLDHIGARTIGVNTQGALLARPDGVPVGAWTGAHDATSRLRDATRSMITAPADARNALDPRSAA